MSDKPKNALKLRLLSALILAPVVLAAVYFGGMFYNAMIGVVGIILAVEWSNMVGRRIGWMMFGAAYITLAICALWLLRLDAAWGVASVFWLLGVVWGADTGGYVFGRYFGGAKLAPSISPNKTWSGFVGGTSMGALAGWGIVSILKDGSWTLDLLMFSALMAVISQIGDLFESWVKRRFGVKDSGTIIPGHGGVFDRVDGLVAVAIALALVNLLTQGNILSWLA